MRWVVFDYGEVISKHTTALPSLAAMLDVPAEEFAEAYWAERRAYDRGCGDEQYWNAVAARLWVEVDNAMIRKLVAMDIEGWLHTREDTLGLITDLRESGMRLALLSNAPASFGRVAETQPWTRDFEHLIFSGDLLVAKPEASIWRSLLATLEAPAPECLFFDDRQDNVDGARGAGMQAELWVGADKAREALRCHGVLS